VNTKKGKKQKLKSDYKHVEANTQLNLFFAFLLICG